MSVASRYILKRALGIWLFALLSLTLLFLISMLFGNLSMFAEYEVSLGLALRYMGLSIPQMIYWILPFSLCLGILATQAAFSRHVETIAMQACSISNSRIYLPYILVGALATVIMIAFSCYIFPVSQRAAEKLENIEIKSQEVQGGFSTSGGRFRVDKDIYSVEHMDLKRGTITKLKVYHIEQGRITHVYKADAASWDGQAWQTENLTRTYPVAGQGALSFSLDRNPGDLVMAQPRPDVLNIVDLRRYLKRLELDGIPADDIATSYMSRISFSISPLIMTLLVLPFGMRMPRSGGIARGISLGLVLGLAYWSLHSALTALGVGGALPPWLAAWGANAVALMISGVVIYRMKGIYG